ncbi:pyruvate kinase [Parvularcula flava]|uniref:Pyruvate kinase n=1 Tax=Aquisalinus luteolus TaxID=1566827 RepID=A0A8J3A4B1_9PROT|nr:pyruvate kinase [Aquisalinus luteolus]NHK29443.1 pyruvate kinase [Aquisalinus luteolus]GGI01931.1 pyruvate kinase [Aquisalinus luteolus]
MTGYKQTKRCKILATLGPASDAPERIRSLALTGVDAFRLNFSHGEHEEHLQRLKNVRAAEEATGKYLTVVADMQGPKIRVGKLNGGEQDLKYGKEFKLVCDREVDEDGVIPIPHPELFEALQKGDAIMLDDGLLRLTITEIDGLEGKAKVDVPGKLTNRKGINIPGRYLPIDALTEKDKKDLAFALEVGVDYIALSFVQKAKDVIEARKLIGDKAGIISKIEKPAALEELEEIIEHSDAVMVARGDLGVELPLEQVPVAQRRIINLARKAGKPVIVATQMLQSMVDSPMPTRAEASDTASAVYLGADAVMLSAESAVGRHPETVVAIMSRIIQAVEGDETYWEDINLKTASAAPESANAIATSIRHTVGLLGSKAVLAGTSVGSTAFAVARERPRTHILGITPFAETARRISLAWGIQAVVTPDYKTFEEFDEAAARISKEMGIADKGDTILLTAGIPMGRHGGTNTMKVIAID